MELDRPLYVTEPVRCSCCGVTIPRRYWDIGQGLGRPYCSPACQVLEARLATLRNRYQSDETA
jgi:hypothetical protein